MSSDRIGLALDLTKFNPRKPFVVIRPYSLASVRLLINVVKSGGDSIAKLSEEEILNSVAVLTRRYGRVQGYHKTDSNPRIAQRAELVEPGRPVTTKRRFSSIEFDLWKTTTKSSYMVVAASPTQGGFQ